MEGVTGGSTRPALDNSTLRTLRLNGWVVGFAPLQRRDQRLCPTSCRGAETHRRSIPGSESSFPRFRLTAWLASGLVFLLIQPFAFGQASVEISFPLEGHYREGRYMPVRMVAD